MPTEKTSTVIKFEENQCNLYMFDGQGKNAEFICFHSLEFR